MTSGNTDAEQTDSDVEYQIGAHDADSGGVDLGEGSEFLPWDIEVHTALKRLAIDIYSSDSSGIAEPETNSTATIIEAVQKGFLESLSDGEVLFEVTETPVDDALLDDPDYDGPESELALTIRDNGMGMTETTVKRVLRVLGRTLTKDAGDRPGMFGMGFVALFLLTGWDAALELHTHSRKSGEDPVSAIINNRGLTIDHENRLDDRMGENEYGTRINLILKDDITKDDMRSWVRENGEYARTPVVYRELDENNSEQYYREYGQKTLGEDFKEDIPSIVYEDEYIRAVLSPESDVQTLLLDRPLRRGYTRNGPLPWSFDIRLKNENRPIVKSADDDRIGLYVTSEGEYEDMDADRQTLYTPRLQSDEVAMASVAGTRDTLKQDSDFWTDYVFPNVYAEYKQSLQTALNSVSAPEDLMTLSPSELILIKQAVDDTIHDWVTELFKDDRSKDDYTADQLRDDFQQEFSIELPEDIARLLVTLKQEVTVLDPDFGVNEQPAQSHLLDEACGEREVWEVVEETAGRVFMGVSLNQKKANVVWEDSETNRVVELESASEYEMLETALGWERLADVNQSTIDEFDISDDLRSEFEETVGSSDSEPTESAEVTITYRSLSKTGWKLQRVNKTSQEVQTDFREYEETGDRPRYGGFMDNCRPRRLILFPESSDAKISDHYNLASEDLALAKVTDDVADYLSDGHRILSFEEYQTRAASYTVKTSEGLKRISASPDRFILHLVSETVAPHFRNPSTIAEAPQVLSEMQDSDSFGWPDTCAGSDAVYAPITREDLVFARYYIGEEGADSTLIIGDEHFHTPRGAHKELESDTRLYARIEFALLESVPDDVVSFFDSVDADLEDSGMEVVDALLSHYDDTE